jgi:hypothetical protein
MAIQPDTIRVVDEVPFVGGKMSAPVRVGDSVHRRAGPWTPAVQALLAHLHRAGFEAVPTPLGYDAQGREVLSFVPGDVYVGTPDPLPAWMFEDDNTLVAAARLLRRYHDALRGFVPPPDPHWRTVAPGKHEVICHNDWAPYNAVFSGHAPIAMLDWDVVGPGSRVWDVARSAYSWVPLLPAQTSLSVEERVTRFGLFCDSYTKGIDHAEVFDTLIEQLRFRADFVEAEAATDPAFAKLVERGFPVRFRTHADHWSAHRRTFAAPKPER